VNQIRHDTNQEKHESVQNTWSTRSKGRDNDWCDLKYYDSNQGPERIFCYLKIFTQNDTHDIQDLHDTMRQWLLGALTFFRLKTKPIKTSSK